MNYVAMRIYLKSNNKYYDMKPNKYFMCKRKPEYLILLKKLSYSNRLML